jgi:hypothetical protein
VLALKPTKRKYHRATKYLQIKKKKKKKKKPIAVLCALVQIADKKSNVTCVRLNARGATAIDEAVRSFARGPV